MLVDSAAGFSGTSQIRWQNNCAHFPPLDNFTFPSRLVILVSPPESEIIGADSVRLFLSEAHFGGAVGCTYTGKVVKESGIRTLGGAAVCDEARGHHEGTWEAWDAPAVSGSMEFPGGTAGAFPGDELAVTATATGPAALTSIGYSLTPTRTSPSVRDSVVISGLSASKVFRVPLQYAQDTATVRIFAHDAAGHYRSEELGQLRVRPSREYPLTEAPAAPPTYLEVDQRGAQLLYISPNGVGTISFADGATGVLNLGFAPAGFDLSQGGDSLLAIDSSATQVRLVPMTGLAGAGRTYPVSVPPGNAPCRARDLRLMSPARVLILLACGPGPTILLARLDLVSGSLRLFTDRPFASVAMERSGNHRRAVLVGMDESNLQGALTWEGDTDTLTAFQADIGGSSYQGDPVPHLSLDESGDRIMVNGDVFSGSLVLLSDLSQGPWRAGITFDGGAVIECVTGAFCSRLRLFDLQSLEEIPVLSLATMPTQRMLRDGAGLHIVRNLGLEQMGQPASIVVRLR